LLQEELWCRILEAYKPNHVVSVVNAKTFMKSLWRQGESLHVVPLTKEVWTLICIVSVCFNKLKQLLLFPWKWN